MARPITQGAGMASAGAQARSAARRAAPWVEPAARAGYAARGAIYVIIGLLAAQAAFGGGGQVTDSSGALETVLRQPAGSFLLVVLAVGLLGYALWRIVTAVADTEGKGSDAKGIASRVGHAVRALIYGGLGVEALRELGSSSYGPWLLGLTALGLVAYGCWQFVVARYRRIAV